MEFEVGRYWVQSRSNGDLPYLVDMAEFGGNGWCGCPGFLHYIDALEQGAAPSPATQCRHIRAVIDGQRRQRNLAIPKESAKVFA